MKTLTGSKMVCPVLTRSFYQLQHSKRVGNRRRLQLHVKSKFYLMDFIKCLVSILDLHLSIMLSVKTINGNDTLHDTVGIAYKECSELMFPKLQRDEEGWSDAGNPSNGRRRRTYEANIRLIETYPKKPKMLDNSMTPVLDPKWLHESSSLIHAKKLDFIWFATLSLN